VDYDHDSLVKVENLQLAFHRIRTHLEATGAGIDLYDCSLQAEVLEVPS
jgi:hypothetical protein